MARSLVVRHSKLRTLLYNTFIFYFGYLVNKNHSIDILNTLTEAMYSRLIDGIGKSGSNHIIIKQASDIS